MGIEWVRIYNSKPEVKMALGEKEFIVYDRIRKRCLRRCSRVVAAGEASEKGRECESERQRRLKIC